MATYRIYSLSDPRDGLARYVGRTCNPVEVRFKQHWKSGVRHGTLGGWFEDLKSMGLKPIPKLLQEHDHPFAEWFWITSLSKSGHPLMCMRMIAEFPWPSLEAAILEHPHGSTGSSDSHKIWRKANRDAAYEQVKRWRAKYPEAYRAIARKSQAKWRAKRKELLAQIASVPKPTVPTEPDPWLSM